MKSNINNFLFNIIGLLIFIPYAFLFYNLFLSIYKLQSTKNWISLPVQIINFELKHNSKTHTEKINVLYKYNYNNYEYISKNFDFSNYANNFSKNRIQKQMFKLQHSKYNVLINPNNPEESILDNSFPEEELIFFTLFSTFFGCIGVFWIFFPLNYISKNLKIKKIINFIPFVILLFFPIYSLFFFSILTLKTILIQLFIITLLVFWYFKSLKYIKLI